MEKRNISALEYLIALQIEFLLYAMRSKIYPYNKDREKFKNIMDYKKSKIEDISKKNHLLNIFTDDVRKREFDEEFLRLFVKGDVGTKKDKYFYYHKKSLFAYEGDECMILSYDLNESLARIDTKEGEKEVSFSDIRRIL